jgi:hypothetical protein
MFARLAAVSVFGLAAIALARVGAPAGSEATGLVKPFNGAGALVLG